jgi:hypothetical protein
MFEDTQGLLRRRKSNNDRQCQKKSVKRRAMMYQTHTEIKTKDWPSRTPLKPGSDVSTTMENKQHHTVSTVPKFN